jgi:hypothetical protein
MKFGLYMLFEFMSRIMNRNRLRMLGVNRNPYIRLVGVSYYYIYEIDVRMPLPKSFSPQALTYQVLRSRHEAWFPLEVSR